MIIKSFKKRKNSGFITVVSGLPRSGTSMMMNMLKSGGMPVIKDNARKPDPDNPRGYFEFNRVKAIKKGDVSWLAGCAGKAVKIVSPILEYLPPTHSYRIIFMNRHIEEILVSQRLMRLSLKGQNPGEEDEKMSLIYGKHLNHVKRWMAKQPNFKMLEVIYADVISNPLENSKKVNQFLEAGLNVHKMARVVETSLYRQRKV